MHDLLIDLDINENIQYKINEAIINCNDKNIIVTIIITNKRIVFLQDQNKNTVVETLNITKKFYTVPKLESIIELKKEEIINYNYIDGGTEILTNNKKVFIFNQNLIDLLAK